MDFKDLKLNFREDCYGGNQTNFFKWENGKEIEVKGYVDEWFDGIEYTLHIEYDNDITEVFESKWVEYNTLIAFIKENCKNWVDLEGAKYHILRFLEKTNKRFV